MATSGTILTELAYGLCSLLNTLLQDLSDVWKGDFEKQHVNQRQCSIMFMVAVEGEESEIFVSKATR